MAIESNTGIEGFSEYLGEQLFPKPPLGKAIELSLFALPIVPVFLFRRFGRRRIFLGLAAVASFWIWRALDANVKLQPGATFIIGKDKTEVKAQAKPLFLISHWLGGLVAFALCISALIRPRRSRQRRGPNPQKLFSNK